MAVSMGGRPGNPVRQVGRGGDECRRPDTAAVVVVHTIGLFLAIVMTAAGFWVTNATPL
jgi:hypothetical protein